MHVAVDLNWFLQFVVLAFAGVFALLYLVRNTASRYFVVDSNFDSPAADYSSLDRRKRDSMSEAAGGAAETVDSCAVCGLSTTKQCARCKMVKYCSEACQKSHWNSGHKTKCKDLQSLYKANHSKPSSLRGRKASLVPSGGSSKILKQSNKILFPYEEFVNFFNWDKPGYPPCGLLNCGNSCFANVVLQCLTFTRPLVAYLLEKGHRIECQKDDWCFLCEFQLHVERASRSLQPFSPMNILSRLPNIGGNLGYGKQEDAHEFMRFAIDTMQSVCLDEFGGEKAVHPSYQETTLIQHIFGGRLRSQVICTECNNVSNQFENMMDLTVEIHGDAGSLEECLDQFTAKEWLHGDNMYKCDGCNAYVMAWKRLTIQRAPNILTIALKRFQSGRFGKLNKRVTFPETLDLSPYMSELEDTNNVYKLYAVIVHVDMLNASFFGHYICYVTDFCGKWYRIDDCKVAGVDLDEVLSQGAYMLLYSRICPRPSCLLPSESLQKEESGNPEVIEVNDSLKQPAECFSDALSGNGPANSGKCLSEVNFEEELSLPREIEDGREDNLPVVKDVELQNSNGLPVSQKEVASPVKPDNNEANSAHNSLIDKIPTPLDAQNSESSPSVSDVENDGVGLLRNLSEKSNTTEKSTFEEGNINSNGSLKPANPTLVPEYVRPENDLSSSNGIIHNGTKKSVGESSSAKLKPVFAPGFLGKHPRKKCINSEDKVSAEPIEVTPELNNHIHEESKHRTSCENGGLLNRKPEIMHESGKASQKSGVFKSLENGYSSDQSVVNGSG